MSDKKLMDVRFLECPNCKHLVELTFYTGDNLYECEKCNMEFSREKARIKVLKMPYVTCLDCGYDVSLTLKNRGLEENKTYTCPVCKNRITVE